MTRAAPSLLSDVVSRWTPDGMVAVSVRRGSIGWRCAVYVLGPDLVAVDLERRRFLRERRAWAWRAEMVARYLTDGPA